MQLVSVKKLPQVWLSQKDIGSLIGRKTTATYLITKEFRKFIKDKPNFFKPVTPYLEGENLYNLYAITYFLEHRQELNSGVSGLSFEEDLDRLKEAY